MKLWRCGFAAVLSFIGLPLGSPRNRAGGLDRPDSTFSSTSVGELIPIPFYALSAPPPGYCLFPFPSTDAISDFMSF